MKPRRVNKNHLILVYCLYTQHLLPSGLRLAGGNTELLFKKKVEECRLPNIRPSYKGD